MKKRCLAAALLLIMVLCTGCGGRDYDVKVVIPAGNTAEEMAWSAEEISPKGRKVTFSSGENLGDCAVNLLPTEVKEENTYDEAVYLTPGISAEMKAEKDGWFRVGVAMMNDTDQDITVIVHVENVDVRIQ